MYGLIPMGDRFDGLAHRMAVWLFGGVFSLLGLCMWAVSLTQSDQPRMWVILGTVVSIVVWSSTVRAYWGSDISQRFKDNFEIYRAVLFGVSVCGVGIFLVVKRLVTGAW